MYLVCTLNRNYYKLESVFLAARFSKGLLLW